MEEQHLQTQKDRNMFFAGVLVGLTGGLISGLFAAAFYDLVNLFNLSWDGE